MPIPYTGNEFTFQNPDGSQIKVRGWGDQSAAVFETLDGDLLWYRHDGRHDGSFTWAAGSPAKVGAGWAGLHNVFAGHDGVIYGINEAGDLLWYRHDGRQGGTFDWGPGSPKKVGVGWGSLRVVFAGL